LAVFPPVQIPFRFFIHEQPPDAAEKTINALDALGVPRLHHFERAHEHFVKAERVRAVFTEHVVGFTTLPRDLDIFCPSSPRISLD
jgi:hypothetical protein